MTQVKLQLITSPFQESFFPESQQPCGMANVFWLKWMLVKNRWSKIWCCFRMLKTGGKHRVNINPLDTSPEEKKQQIYCDFFQILLGFVSDFAASSACCFFFRCLLVIMHICCRVFRCAGACRFVVVGRVRYYWLAVFIEKVLGKTP